MHRLTARFSLLIALLGSFAPAAFAVMATPPHACCVRKAHRGHDSVDPETELAFSAPSCCKNNGCRAVTSARWAHAQPRRESFLTQSVNPLAAASPLDAPPTAPAQFQASRAPPAC
jgi:hypothetical protein